MLDVGKTAGRLGEGSYYGVSRPVRKNGLEHPRPPAQLLLLSSPAKCAAWKSTKTTRTTPKPSPPSSESTPLTSSNTPGRSRFYRDPASPGFPQFNALGPSSSKLTNTPKKSGWRELP